MQKIVVVLLLLFFASFLLFPAQGQSPSPLSPLDRSKEDYNFQYLKFREREEQYLTAKNSYISFKTAIAKDEAYTATKSYLFQVDNLYIVLVFLAQEQTNSLDWRTHGAQKEELGKSLSQEVDFLRDHQKRASEAKTLEELSPLGSELKDRIKNTLERKLNKTIASLEVIESEDAFEDFNQISQILDKIVQKKISQGRTDTVLFNWTSEIADIKNKTTQNLQEARKELEKPKSETLSSGAMENVTASAKKAKTELARSKPLFEEILRIL